MPAGLGPEFPAWARTPARWWEVSEPSTTVTDYLLAAVAATLAARLLAAAGPRPAALLLALAFAAVGASALAGGTAHGFTRQLGERRWRALWRAMLAGAALTSALLLAGVAVAMLDGALRLALLALAAAKVPLVLARSWRDGDFRWIVRDSGATLFAIGLLAAVAWTSRGTAGSPAAPWLLGSTVTSVAAGAVQRAGVGLHRHLNHNDLYHLGQCVALYLFYRAALVLVAA